MRRTRPLVSIKPPAPIIVDPVTIPDIDVGGPGDLLERVMAERFPPDVMLQISPALDDLALLGVGGVRSTVDDLLDDLRAEVGPFEPAEVTTGEDLVIPEGASQLQIAAAIVEARRSTRIGLWFGTPPAPQASLELALQGTDLGTVLRLVADIVNPRAPFAMRVTYEGIARAIRARFSSTGGAMSLNFEPCSCGPLLLNDVRVGQLRVGVTGGGVSDRPPTDTIALDTVTTVLSLSLVGSELALGADVSVDEAVDTRRRGTGSADPDKYRVLSVTSKVRLDVTSVDTRGKVGDLVDRLKDGELGQKVLGALLGPFARVREGVVEGLVNWAEGEAEEQLPSDEGVLTELADQLGAPILLPAANGAATKLLFETDRAEVGATRFDLRGEAFVLVREPRLAISAQGLGGHVRVTALTSDFRAPSFAWSSPTGVFDGPVDAQEAVVNFPSNVGGIVRVDVIDADGFSGFAEGPVGQGLVTLVPGVAG